MSIVKDRLEKFQEEEFDSLMLKIKSGTIKCGRYSHLVKVDKKRMKGKVFFNDGQSATPGASEEGKSKRR